MCLNMEIRLTLLATLILHACICGGTVTATEGQSSQSESRSDSIFDNGMLLSLRHLYNQCAESEDIYWCSKVQIVKILGRALKVPSIKLLDGLSIVKKSNENETRAGRSRGSEHSFSNQDVERLSAKSLDALLFDRFLRFLRSRQIQINLPRLLVFGHHHGEQLIRHVMSYFTPSWYTSESESEGRGKKKDDKKYLGAFVAAVMLKAAILKMAYHSIAILAGKALIVGKIALIISAIIGLKKLVSHEGGEKTTYEIVKHPQVQQSHTYSSSHGGEYESGHEGGSYHRSIDDEMMMQDKAYNAWVPTTKLS